MLSPLESITAVIINFRTPDLTERAVRTFRRFYPGVRLLLIDNGSGDTEVALLRELKALDPGRTTLVLNTKNLHHGPAMDQALRLCQTPFVFFLDSDCEVTNGGFLEKMFALADGDAKNYAVGKRIFMNDRGFDSEELRGAHPYIRPICMLVRRNLYLGFPPFERHGAPCLANFIAADKAGLVLVHFPVEEYVHHEGRGTAMRHGYRLGLRGRINHLLNRLKF